MARVTTSAAAAVCIVLSGLAAIGCDVPRGPAPDPRVEARARERAAEIATRFEVAMVPPGGLDVVTPFSRVRLHDLGLQRSLLFVHDDGTAMLQSRIDLTRPHRLVVPYTRTMFASYLFHPEPSRVLIVGLGGGAMVRFLEHHDPDLHVDAVDIDPEIVAIAQRYFGVRPSERVRLLVADGYQVVRGTAVADQAGEASVEPVAYDVIYMDAFLRPSDETDRSGNPLRLKDAPFYAAMRQRLTPDGVAVFNLNPQPQRESDVLELRRAFPQLYLFHDGEDLNWVAVATEDPRRRTVDELRALAAELDPRFEGDLSLSDLVPLLEPATTTGAAG